ncbi:DNA-binding protein [Candidatus Woesearchaeota archaeon]|nr:MAG: DNA-binding protein [Candidatus Woesearchaeota archaeon]
MNIAQLQPRQGQVELVARVKSKESPRTFSKEGSVGTVCKARLQDETGEITLTLWNEQVDQVKVGDTIKIVNGYVGEWQGELQLSTGKFGKLEVVESKNHQEEGADIGFDEEEIE